MEPFRKWKVSFDGYLRVTSTPSSPKTHPKIGDFVRVSFQLDWNAFTEPFHFDSVTPMSLALALARERWTPSFFRKLQNRHVHIEQWGELRGPLHIRWTSDSPLRWIQVSGMRDRSYPSRDWSQFRRYVTHCVTFQDGHFLHLSFIHNETFSDLVVGYLILPNGTFDGILCCRQSIRDLGDDGQPPSRYELHVSLQSGIHFRLHVSLDSSNLYFFPNGQIKIIEHFATFSAFGSTGVGIAEYSYSLSTYPHLDEMKLMSSSLSSQKHDSKLIGNVSPNDPLPLLLPLSHPSTLSTSLVGGKAAAASLLKWYSLRMREDSMNERDPFFSGPRPIFHPTTSIFPPTNHLKKIDFSVPNGVCLTSAAHESFLSNMPKRSKFEEVLRDISRLWASKIKESRDCSSSFPPASLPTLSLQESFHRKLSLLCDDIHHLYIQSEIPSILRNELTTSFIPLFPRDAQFAIRSSAITEDTIDSAAAGQLESLLGISGEDRILEAIKECWASQYTVRSVCYRLTQVSLDFVSDRGGDSVCL